jgi:hypothetical protein
MATNKKTVSGDISAFMGMTSKTTDLRLLKKLVFNSIKYSSLTESRSRFDKTLLAAEKFFRTNFFVPVKEKV